MYLTNYGCVYISFWPHFQSTVAFDSRLCLNLLLDFSRWVQAVFKAAHGNCMSGERTGKQVNHMEEDCYKPKVKDITWKDATNRSEIDLSEGMGVDMFGISSSSEEVKISLLFSYAA